MPHENKAEEVEEAVEAVADAIERVDDNADTDRPPPSSSSKRDKVRSWAALLTHLVALVAAAGALLKTCDHSVTKSAYDALSGDISKLNDQAQKNHDDLVAIHGYLDGLAHSSMTPAAGPMTITLPLVADAGAPRPVTKNNPRPPSSAAAWAASSTLTAAMAAAAAEKPEAGTITFDVEPVQVANAAAAAPAAPAPAAVPDVHPDAPPVKPLSFDQAVSK